jgi:aminopeptidase N
VVTVTVAQVQDFARGIPVFRVPVSIAVVTAGGKVARTVWIREKAETFEFPAESKPLLVRFDEGNALIKEVSFPKDLDELLYQLRQDDVIGRMGAATELLRFKDDPRTFDALAASAQSDPFWAVRRSAVDAMGQLPDGRVRAALRRTSLDRSSTVRTASLAALGNLKDPGLVEFFKERFANDDSELVKAESLRALGKTGDAGVIPFVQKAAAVPSHRNLVGNAATQALKQLAKQ